MKFLKLLIILALIFFPFGELLRFDIGSNIIFKPLDLAVGAIALVWFTLVLFQKKFPALKKEFLFFPLIALITLIINSTWLKPYEFIASALYLIRWMAYTALFFVVSGFDKQFKEKIKLYLIIDGVAILLFAYLQYFLYPSLKSLYYLGWDEHMFRMFSVFLDPNYAGAFFVLYFLYIGDILNKMKSRNWYLIIIFLLTLIAVFLTFSRSALLMLIVGSFVYLFLIKRKKLILILLGAIIIFALIFSSKFNIENINLFREASVTARLDNYSTAIKIIADHPLLGIGFNSYRYAKETYGIKMGWTKAPSHADAGADNSFLFILATTGIIGFAAYIYLWIAILKKASPLVISSAIALFINTFFINSLFYAPLMLWTWIILALL